MSDIIYPDVTCPQCNSKYGIMFSNGIVRCSTCKVDVANAKVRHT